jgi:hypothetical protein
LKSGSATPSAPPFNNRDYEAPSTGTLNEDDNTFHIFKTQPMRKSRKTGDLDLARARVQIPYIQPKKSLPHDNLYSFKIMKLHGTMAIPA